MTIVDIGCGQGYFALAAARLPGVRVYGIDVDEGALALLNRRAEGLGLSNVTTIVGAAEHTIACAACADIVFFGICLHDFEDPGEALANARRMLKPGGTLADLDWKKVPTEGGPPLEKRFSEEKASRLIEAAGFTVGAVADLDGRYYLITAI